MNIDQVREVKKEIVGTIYFIISEIEKSAIKLALLEYDIE